MRLLKQLILPAFLLAIFPVPMCGAKNVDARIPVVLSTDVGNEVDDQWAISYLLLQPRFRVLGVMSAHAPLVIGPGKVCRENLSLTLDQAREMIATRGAIGDWLWQEYQAWYYRFVKPLRVNDFSKPWVIWDNITLAYVLGMTEQHTLPRPRLRDDMSFEQVKSDRTVTWITDVDEKRMWADFLRLLDDYQRTHAVRNSMKCNRLTFLMP